MGVSHDLALLDIAILLKHLGDFCLAQTGVDASDKEVGAWVDGTVVIAISGASGMVALTVAVAVILDATDESQQCQYKVQERCLRKEITYDDLHIPIAARGSGAATTPFVVVANRARRGTPVVALVARGLVW